LREKRKSDITRPDPIIPIISFSKIIFLDRKVHVK